MGRLFGTDGVRGLANGLLTPELALEVARAAAVVLGASGGSTPGRPRPRAVLGRDPRPSGEFLEAAVVAGLSASGVDVELVGVIPTPAVAFLTRVRDADFGVVLSASHNPMPDNGIKFFGRGGSKLADEVELAIEAAMPSRGGDPSTLPLGAAVGRVTTIPEATSAYAHYLIATMPDEGTLAGLSIVLDCANGAAATVAPEVFARCGASVTVVNAETDGLRINEHAGSTDLGSVRAAVLASSADVGFAFDGDADRVLAVDAQGDSVDGDQIMAVLALALRARGRLPGNRLAATVMSNLGLSIAMRSAGIEIVMCDVGDRHVLAAMEAQQIALGGEQSGHVVLREHATTGDGILTALAVAAEMASSDRSLADLASVVTRLPQVLVNVAGVDKSVTTHPDVLAEVARAERELGATGRVLLRPSGTEPLVRVMVEARTAEQAQTVADSLADVVRARCSLPA